ncbi:MAG: acetolactate decarboxylase [Desulfovibrionales bacterium]
MLKKRLFLIALLVLFISGCAGPPKDTAFQTSTIDALLAGVYDGDMSCRELLRHGDFGIGTFQGLDGEMVLVNGNIYQIKADGKVYRPDLALKTPFATVCEFVPDHTLTVNQGADYNALKELIDSSLPNQNLFYAIKITGKFRSMKTRSVPGQEKPYPPLKAVTKNQPEFSMRDISGTIVGFRCPPYVKGINVPGYHLHFISRDRETGGHVLGFEVESGECAIDVINRYTLVLPKKGKRFSRTDLGRDRSLELKEVEGR